MPNKAQILQKLDESYRLFRAAMEEVLNLQDPNAIETATEQHTTSTKENKPRLPRYIVNGIPFLQRQMVRHVITQIAPTETYQSLLEKLDSRDILGMRDKLIVTEDQYKELPDSYENRYFDEVFTSKDGIRFKFWNNFGETINIRGKETEGATPKFIRAVQAHFAVAIQKEA